MSAETFPNEYVAATQQKRMEEFRARYRNGCDGLPQNLQGMAERLLSRFASGLVAEVYPPELETRIAILRKKAEQDGVKLDDETAALIASAGSNVRELEGMLMKLSIRASLNGRGVIDAGVAGVVSADRRALQREGPHHGDVLRSQGGEAPGGRPGGRRRPGGHLPEAGLCGPVLDTAVGAEEYAAR